MMLSAHLPRHNDGLMDFSELDAKLKGIRIINIIPISLRFISKLYLDGNYLLSLSGIQQFYNLEIFHFDYNLISLPTQLNKIANPFFIHQLSFISNPIYENATLTKQYFKKKGFSRIEVLNPSHHLSSCRNTFKRSLKQQNQNVSTQLTAKRKSHYNEEQSQMKTSRKKMIGKLYNPEMLTKRIRRRQHKSTSNSKNKQTKQSTDRGAMAESPIQNQIERITENSDRTQQINIKPFEADVHEYDQTAKFSGQDTTMKIGQQFIEQQKQHLSICFYERGLLQKCFAILKKLSRFEELNKQLQQSQGLILNNSIETYRFSLIKLQHQMIKYK